MTRRHLLILALPPIAVARADFTIAVLPDTQIYARQFPEIFVSQTSWIRDNAAEEDIVFMLHEGDIVNRGNAPDHVYQWDNADVAISLLDGVVPYALAVGNHDLGPNGEAEDRDTTHYNLYFPFTRYEAEPWYGGHMGDDNDNHYVFFEADGMAFMVITIEFGPNSEMVGWANEVVAAHPEKRVIVLTHCFTFHDDTRVGIGDSWNPHTYGIANIDDPHDGDELWEAFVRCHPNIFLVLGGHILGDGVGRLTQTGVFGNDVHQVLANYQMLDEGGQGWMRLLRFIPSEDRIEVATYSPWLDEVAIDGQNLFDLPYEMSLPGDWNGDGAADLADYEHYLACVSGPDADGVRSGCEPLDIDSDGDVDLRDFGAFQSLLNAQ